MGREGQGEEEGDREPERERDRAERQARENSFKTEKQIEARGDADRVRLGTRGPRGTQTKGDGRAKMESGTGRRGWNQSLGCRVLGGTRK